MLAIYDMRTEYLENPVGVDAAHPRFSWKLKSDKRNIRQTSYHIIARSGKQVIWDSGVVASGDNLRICYDGEALSSRQRVSWRVEVTAGAVESGAYRFGGKTGYEESNGQKGVESETDGFAVSGEACFEMGLLHRGDWAAKWIEPESEVNPEAKKPAPYLRKSFQVKPGLIDARIYQSAHGLYEFWINGEPGTLDKFKPGLTSYYHRIQYQDYDITGLLRQGENVWAVMLGDGWWRGVTGGSVKNNFGYRLHYFGQIELTYEDGTKDIIPTDDTFRHCAGGLLASDMLMGDIYDASLEPEGWKMPGYDDRGWQQVHITEEHADAALIPCRSVPVREKEVFYPKEFRDGKGKRILDFGQNIAGYVKVHLRNCRRGQRVRLLHGEDMKDGCFTQDNINQPVLKVDTFQEVSYFCAGYQEEFYCPLFSVFGFRYVMLEGYEEEIIKGDFQAVAVYSDMGETGAFTCSNPLINQLVSNSLWSQKGNFLDVAVDCPTRERNAWTGDNQIYVRTASYFMNVYPFYEKWLQDQAIEQYASGKVGITFPSTSSVHNPQALAEAQKTNPTFALAGPAGNGNIGEDCAGWGDSAAWLPYSIYLCYGDRRILRNQYETARKWVDYMLCCAKEHNPLYEGQPQYHTYTDGELDADYIYDTRMHYGEWQEPIVAAPLPEGMDLAAVFARMVKEGKPKVATAYMCRSSENVAMMAGKLGLARDVDKYQKITERIRRVYDRYFIGEDGQIEPGHQAAYVRALAFNLCSEEKRPLVQAQLVKEIEANGYKLNTGFLSTPFLLPVLVEMGRTDLAYRLLEQTENPSWLHPITLGATTIPESWDGFDIHEASLNHYSYGAVCEFLFGYVGGIRPLWDKPGYEEFLVQPVPGGSLTFAKAEYESQYGRIVSSWKIESERIVFDILVPVNTKALVILPDGSRRQVGSGKYHYTIRK